VTVPRAIGVTSLTGGGIGSLDNEHVKDSNGNIAINDGDPAFALVQGDKVYHYIANSTSGATANGIYVIVPLWESVGVTYTGNLRWILHGVYGSITSTPGSGEYQITDIRLDASKHIVVKYNDTAEA